MTDPRDTDPTAASGLNWGCLLMLFVCLFFWASMAVIIVWAIKQW